MARTALPPEILAENLLNCGAIIAHPGDPDFDDLGDIEDCVMENHCINREITIMELRRLENDKETSMSFALETGLGHLLGLTGRKVISDPDWTPLHEFEHQQLLASVFGGLAGAVMHMSDRIPVDQLQEGMLAAATILNNLRSGQFDNDRHRDAASQVKILIHRARILQHEEMIEERQQERQRATVSTMLPNSTSDAETLFG